MCLWHTAPGCPGTQPVHPLPQTWITGKSCFFFFPAADGEGAGRKIKIHRAKAHPHEVQNPFGSSHPAKSHREQKERARRGSCPWNGRALGKSSRSCSGRRFPFKFLGVLTWADLSVQTGPAWRQRSPGTRELGALEGFGALLGRHLLPVPSLHLAEQ